MKFVGADLNEQSITLSIVVMNGAASPFTARSHTEETRLSC